MGPLEAAFAEARQEDNKDQLSAVGAKILKLAEQRRPQGKALSEKSLWEDTTSLNTFDRTERAFYFVRADRWGAQKVSRRWERSADSANSDEYVNKIDEIRRFIGDQLATPVLLDGSELTGERLALLVPPLTEALSNNEGISPPSLVEAACDAQAEPIVREALG